MKVWLIYKFWVDTWREQLVDRRTCNADTPFWMNHFRKQNLASHKYVTAGTAWSCMALIFNSPLGQRFKVFKCYNSCVMRWMWTYACYIKFYVCLSMHKYITAIHLSLTVSHLHVNNKQVGCKNTSSIFWSSQLHACCVYDTLQTLRDTSNLIQSLNVVEKLLLYVKLGSADCIPSISTITMQPRNSSKGRCVRSEKHQTPPKMLIYRPSAKKILI